MTNNLSFKMSSKRLGIVEKEGILVRLGSLERSDLSSQAEYPVYLWKDHRFSELVVEDCHLRGFHCTVKATSAELTSRFWIPKGRQFVKRILKRCLIRRKLGSKTISFPPTAAIPEYRVTQAAPFSNVGIDFAGPLYVKEKRGEFKKVNICLLVCLLCNESFTLRTSTRSFCSHVS